MDPTTRVDDVNEAPDIRDKGRVDYRARQDTVTATDYDKKRNRMALDCHLLCTRHDRFFSDDKIPGSVPSPRANHCDDVQLSLGSRFLLTIGPFCAVPNCGPAFPESRVQDFRDDGRVFYQDMSQRARLLPCTCVSPCCPDGL